MATESRLKQERHNMKILRTARMAIFASLAGLMTVTPACAERQPAPGSKAEMDALIRAYILENPEIIEEALIQLRERERASEQNQQAALIADNQSRLINNPADYSVGPDDAPITVVEFFDYRCGYCKRSASWTMALPEAFDNQVRVVFKEYPILSPESEQAALAAIAAGQQGKYEQMHTALMQLDNAGGFGPQQIDEVAKSVGVDVLQMRADMQTAPVIAALEDSMRLGRDIGVSGTPNFIIGNQMVPGANRPA